MSIASEKSAVRIKSPGSRKPFLVFLVLFGLFTLFFNLGGRSLENKDSVGHPEIAREILESKDWIMLHENGKIYVDKPPLHHWLTALSFKAFGVNTFAARFPEAAAAFCGILLAFFYSKSIFRNDETAFLAAIMLLATFGYLWWARRTRTDIEFSVFFAASLISFYRGCQAEESKIKILWYMAFWLATGGAFLEKAFIAFSNFAICIPYVILSVFKSGPRKISAKLLVLTSPVLALVIFPWIWSLYRHPEFQQYWEVLKYTEIASRTGGLFEYVIDLPMKIFPGTPFFFMGLWAFYRFRKHLPDHRGLTFMLLWIGVYFFMLHFTEVKDTRYLIPLYLPCAVVGAWAASFYSEKYPEHFDRVIRHADRLFLAAAALSLIIPFIFCYVHEISLRDPWPYVTLLGLALLSARKFLPLKVAGLFISFIILFLSIEVGETVVNKKTATYLRISQGLKSQGLSPENIRIFSCVHSSKEQSALSFYYNHLIRCSEDLSEILADPDVKAIVAENKYVEPKISLRQIKNHGQIIPYGKKYFILLKSNAK